MEFKLLNPKTENDFLTEISFNFDDLEKGITQSLEKYQGLTYTEENIKEAKLDKANLNKFREALETKRKDVKKLCLKPYNDFEEKIKYLVNLVDGPIKAIDTQVKGFEQQKKDAKYKEILSFYDLNIGDLKDLVPLEKILDPKWGNATLSLAKIQTELSEKIAKINCDLQAISIMKSEFELNIKDTYLRTLDLSTALREKTRLEEQKKLLEQREVEKKQASIGNIQPPPVTPEPSERIQTIEEKTQEIGCTVNHFVESETSPVAVLEKPETRTVKFWIEGTNEQILALRQFLIDNGIKYGGIN